MAFADRLESLLVRGDVRAATATLRSLAGEELREARDWFARSKRWVGELHTLPYQGADDERFDSRWDAYWIVALCAVRLCGPATAAARVPWQHLWSYRVSPGELAFVEALRQADRSWVGDFAAAAAQARLGGNARNVEATLTRVVRAGLVHHHLPAPSGPVFYRSWLAGSPALELPSGRGAAEDAERLARDPLMPDLLWHYLASGHCGHDPWLPAATAELVRRGNLDRSALLEHVLGLLTAPQRPKSQAVLAQVAAALDVRADEVPGGLTYLLGVMATSHGQVVPVLLPLAAELVTDGESLVELTRVVAGRGELRPKQVLLRAIQSDPVRSAAGTQVAAEALDMLGAGDDAAFSAQVARVRSRLGIGTAAPEQPERPARCGLWDAVPVAVEPERRFGRLVGGRQAWRAVLDAKARNTDERDTRRMGDELLTEMARGEFDGAFLADEVQHLLDAGRFAAADFARVFGDVFLAGGLRQGWPVALEIADAACRAARPPAALPALLRMLASFAHEVPAQDLPPALLELATGDGHTKARVEARRLGAVLAGCDAETFLARLRAPDAAAGAPSSSHRPSARGLWREDDDVDPLPSQRPVVPGSSRLDALREALSENFNYYTQSHVDVCFWPPSHLVPTPATSLTNPELVLAATVRAIHERGAEQVRAALAGIPREYPPVDVVAAIDFWATGGLDTAMFWRIAGHARTYRSLDEALARDPSLGYAERRDRVDALVFRPVPGDDPESVLLPRPLDSAVARLAFLRACESLLLAEANPVVLATPTWADGTLAFSTLLERLASGNGAAVGALDLVQALYRLRPVDAAALDQLDRAPVPTSAALTTPDGRTTWNALDVITEWVAAGGLPALEPVAVDGRWTTGTVAPVPWSRCAALPAELREDPWYWSAIPSDQVRLMPRWADRAIEHAHLADAYFDPRFVPGRAAGPLGEPFHDRILGFLAGKPNGSSEPLLATVVDLARHDRLDPDAAVAAALGRHAAGILALGRLTQGFADVVERGGLRGLWPSALAIAAALTEVPNKPSGLAQLLRLLTGYAAEVPKPEVPEELRRFAAAAGSTRSQVEARALVAALEGR